MNDVVMTATRIRPAHPADGVAVLDLLGTMGGHDDLRERAHPLETFAALLAAPEGRVLVAERDGSVVGVAVIAARLSLLADRREAWLGALAVAPTFRSIGVGAALLGALEREAADLGCAAIVLEASLMREGAHAFYRASGFTEIRTARRFERPVVADGDDLVDRFIAAAARAATRVALAVVGRAAADAVGIGADGAPTEDADDAAERAALAELLPLGVPVVSEEAGLVGATSIDPAEAWISLDPLDGSRNFRAGFPMYATSIGLVRAGRPIAGLVADLVSGHRWAARSDAGATLDGRAIRTRRSLLGAVPSPLPGYPTMRDLPGIERTRISGSTASDLVRVADGTLAVFYALDRPVVHVHDLAAAMIVIEEAGGCVIDRSGTRPFLVPDPAVTLDIVAAYDRPFALALAGAS